MRTPLGWHTGVTVALFVAVAPFQTVLAECIAVVNGPTACQQLAKADLVFEAEVLDVDLRSGTGFQRVEFRVLRSFKGQNTGRWSGKFSYDSVDHMFSPGTRVIVYATERKDTGIWRAAGCHQTKVFDQRKADVFAEEVAELTSCSSPTK